MHTGGTKPATYLAHDPATRDSNEADLVRIAASRGADVLRAIVAGGAKLDWRADNEQETALAFYAREGFLEYVRVLLDNGAKVDAPSRDAMTALHIAARASRLPVLSLLIERGATIDARDVLGRTPLYYAVRACRADAVETLIAAGADLHAVDSFGSPLAAALPPQCEQRAQIAAALERRP